MKWPEILTLVIGGGLAAKALEVATGRRKARADTADTMTEAAESNVRAAVEIVAEFKEQVTVLRQQNQYLVLEIDNLRKENAELREVVEALRIEVVQLKAGHS